MTNAEDTAEFATSMTTDIGTKDFARDDYYQVYESNHGYYEPGDFASPQGFLWEGKGRFILVPTSIVLLSFGLDFVLKYAGLAKAVYDTAEIILQILETYWKTNQIKAELVYNVLIGFGGVVLIAITLGIQNILRYLSLKGKAQMISYVPESIYKLDSDAPWYKRKLNLDKSDLTPIERIKFGTGQIQVCCGPRGILITINRKITYIIWWSKIDKIYRQKLNEAASKEDKKKLVINTMIDLRIEKKQYFELSESDKKLLDLDPNERRNMSGKPDNLRIRLHNNVKPTKKKKSAFSFGTNRNTTNSVEEIIIPSRLFETGPNALTMKEFQRHCWEFQFHALKEAEAQNDQ